jgi:hypothetical protein
VAEARLPTAAPEEGQTPKRSSGDPQAAAAEILKLLERKRPLQN